MPINNLNELNEKTPLNLWCKSLAEIYKDVTVSDYPMFRWMQFVNDVTILSEEIRRRRYNEAIDQVANILGRYLDFISAYLNNKNNPSFPNTDKERWKVWGKLSELLTASLQLKSYEELPIQHLPEGLTRWILAKYPRVCAKCGKNPCHCVLEPWIFENRREDPEPYKKYKNNIRDPSSTVKCNT